MVQKQKAYSREPKTSPPLRVRDAYGPNRTSRDELERKLCPSYISKAVEI